MEKDNDEDTGEDADGDFGVGVIVRKIRCVGRICELCSTVHSQAESCEEDGAEDLED